jgi:diguanylate cyclase (GGDEF)-like protein
MGSGAHGFRFWHHQMLYFALAALLMGSGFAGVCAWWISGSLEDQARTALQSELSRDSVRFYTRLGKRWAEFEGLSEKKNVSPFGWKNFQTLSLKEKILTPQRKIEFTPDEVRFFYANLSRQTQGSLIAQEFWTLLSVSARSDIAQSTFLYSREDRGSVLLNKGAVLQPALAKELETAPDSMGRNNGRGLRELVGSDGESYWVVSLVLNPYFAKRLILIKTVSKSSIYEKHMEDFFYGALLSGLAVGLALALFLFGLKRSTAEMKKLKVLVEAWASGNQGIFPHFSVREFREIAYLLRRMLKRETEGDGDLRLPGKNEDILALNSLPPRPREPVAQSSAPYSAEDRPLPSTRVFHTQFSTESPTQQVPIRPAPPEKEERNSEVPEETGSSIVNARLVKTNIVSMWEMGDAPKNLKNASDELLQALAFLKDTEGLTDEKDLARKTIEHFQNVAARGSRVCRACWVHFDTAAQNWKIHRTADDPGADLADTWSLELKQIFKAQLIQRFGNPYQNFFSRFLVTEGFEEDHSDSPKIRIFLVAPEGGGPAAFFAIQFLPSDILSDEGWGNYEKIMKAAWIKCHSRHPVITNEDRDELTGLWDRHGFEEMLVEALLTQKTGEFACLWVQVDSYKTLLEKHGQETLDEMLKIVSQKLESYFAPARASLARVSQDQFAVVILGFDEERSLRWADYFRQQIEDLDFKQAGIRTKTTHVALTLSIAIVSCPRDAKTFEEILAVAAETLQIAQDEGGNAIALSADRPGKAAA